MPTTTQINDGLIRDSITRAVQDVFKTMLGQHVTLAGATEHFNDAIDGVPPPPIVDGNHPQVVGTVGFIGDANGLIYLYMNDDFAKLITCKLLGMELNEIDGDEVINDAIGEITNMTVGGFKNALCDCGLPCKLTIPSILRGSNFSVEPISSATRRVYHFDCAGHRLVTDILMKIGD